MGFSRQAMEGGRQLKQKELNAALARDRELDTLFERLYEDNVADKINDERFSRMSLKYEEEQKELHNKIKALKGELEKESGKAVTAEMFISTVRKYTRARKLTPRMLNELIHHIAIPDVLPIPMPDITVNTRKGVYVSYDPSVAGGAA